MSHPAQRVNLNDLNPEQRSAVENFEGPMLILAGAGTGKTRVITYRMAWMLQQGVAASQIAAMTFTNKAAREMGSRIGELVGPERAKGLSVSTFHSFCLRILREHGHAVGISSRFGIVDTGDQVDLVARALKEKQWGGTVPVEDLHAAISRWKNELLGPEDVLAGKGRLAAGYDREVFARIYDLYERQLKINRVIDFDDCIFKTFLLLKNDPGLQKALARKFRYILIDEFQDTNLAQLTLLEMIARHHGNVCVVGDDDQSIYSWRGAMFETLERFEHMFEGTRLVKLEQNYRCSNVILDAANTLIRNNTRRKDKSLWSESKSKLPIRLVPLETSDSEARWIADQCMSLIGGGNRHKDIAVLYRANAQSRPIEMALREAGLHAKVFGGTGFFERKEVKDFLAFVKLASDPDDRLAFWRAVSACPSGVGIKTLERLAALAEEKKCSPIQAAENSGADTLGRVKPAVDEFCEKLREISRMAQGATWDDLTGLGEEIIGRFKLLEEVLLNTKDSAARMRKIEMIKALPAWLSNAAKSLAGNLGQATGTKVDWPALMDRIMLSGEDDRDKGDDKNPADVISLMTVHAAKGLEFPVVFVVGVEEELLPHKNSIDLGEPGIAEERRLFYVALTRAKERLFLSYALDRSSRMGTSTRKPSRFLSEIPKHLLAGEDGEIVIAVDAVTDGAAIAKKREELRRNETVAQLGMLRQSLFRGRNP